MNELTEIEKPVAFELPKKIAANEVIVLPERINEEGEGLYVDSSLELYKELREQKDLQVDYLNNQKQRKWIERLGNGDEVIIPLIVAIGVNLFTSAVWYVIQRFAIERKDNKNTRIKITIANRNPDLSWVWYEFEGDAEEVRKLADHIIDEQSKKRT